ncbi:protease SohB [Rhodoblastus sphagnicola]|uniref:Protease SohB n=1 Tax=Rhodoblastus sphagnicola TaxID=333368 RepID=A0A2S6N0F7_9HYPH|nr:protease SohB [Rhodoblastus sphagnicola]MBB4198563.1 serine protease SohB [Rhodoblastus sphagnicola]PPQ28079.1 protease SohB [Rhodoblastus sphagnicola]
MAFWLDIAAFALKALLIVASIGALAALIARVTYRDAVRRREIEVRSINERYDEMRDELDAEILDRKERRSRAKARKREAKASKREAKARAAASTGKRVYVLGFKGDPMASTVKQLAQEIDAVLTVARPETDEVVLRLQSPGGTVTGYGLAAAEISRLRDRNIKVTVSVDQVAASGGYMMACAADRIVAAPFALVGSIGVVAQAPNLHRLLKKNDIDYEELTAGEFKRSISVLGEITPAGREHALGKIEDIHTAFKSFVAERRPAADIAKIANGDVWLASEAVSLGLVDALSTGDDLLFRLKDEARLFEVATVARKTLLQQLLGGLGFEGASALAPLGAIAKAFSAVRRD